MLENIIMFPGQGSQKTGMGQKFFQQFPQEIKIAKQILGYNPEEMCININNAEKLNQTQFTQPLLFLVNHLYFLDFKKKNLNFEVTIGHSLGEYNALLASGAFDFASGLTIVQKRGELMSKSKGGGMAVVIGLKDIQVEKIMEEVTRVGIANYNSDGQVVISGEKIQLEKLETTLKEKGAKLFRFLPVSGAFHSFFMKEVAEKFLIFLEKFNFNTLQKKVLANITAEFYPQGSTDKIIKEYLVKQLYSSVKWKQSIHWLKQQNPSANFLELGPGNVLQGLVKRIT